MLGLPLGLPLRFGDSRAEDLIQEVAMRLSPLAFSLALMPGFALADDFAVDSRIASATVFPQGASLTRVARVQLPEGRHRLLLSDMPAIDPSGLRLTASGLTLGAVSYRDDLVPPRDAGETAKIEAARNEVEARKAALLEAQDALAALRDEAEAAKARITFLEGLGQSNGVAQSSPEQLRALLELIGEEGLAARRAVQAAETRARPAKDAVNDAKKNLATAEQALAALLTANDDRAYLVVEVDATAPFDGELELQYTTEAASWQPAYDLRLTTGDDPGLTMQRGAFVRQATGEDWDDVALTLSTLRPADQSAPGEVWPWLRRILDPDQMPRPVPMAQRAKAAADVEDAEMLSVVNELLADASFDGISVTYDYAQPVDIANGADALRIALGEVTFTPEVFARATPLSDATAFVAAEFTNDSGELILGSGDARFYLDGTFVGQRYLDLIAEGDEAELSFGPIEGLRLERIVQDRQEGDRGVISRSNEQVEAVEITLRNLTDRAWDLRLRDRVPYSEQEDLQITWEATPAPSEEAVEGRRGVLEWRFAMDPRSEQVITLNHRLRWPEGQVLR
ncbi:MAG: mucoidy inhibitor MuiA family protein [Pseudomonadota bacterium]|nr:mucoidy inhibitor MuiA family protein [Pseudomonadota bacterium]